MKSPSTLSYWRLRIMVFMMLGYAAFYFVRQNLAFATASMQEALRIPLSVFGNMTTAFSLVYGIGKALTGFFCDTHSVRIVFSVGLALSACVSFLIGSVSSVWLMIALWGMNAVFQSAGAPACAKMLTHWFGSKDFGTKWAIWGTSQQIGAAIIGYLIAFLLPFGGWRCAFLVPGLISLIIAVLVFWGVRDKPKDVSEISDLVNDNKTEQIVVLDECRHMTSVQILKKYVLRNKMVWAMGIANFFTYFVKTIVGAWAPLFLCVAKGSSSFSATFQTSAFFVSGVAGSVLAGFLSDRCVNGYRGRVGFLFMVGVIISTFLLWYVPEKQPVLHLLIMLSIGFFIVGPQTVIGVAAIDFSSKRVAGTASGLTGTFGYLGSACAGVGTAYIAEHALGWNGVFIFMIGASLLGCLALIPSWKVRSKAYDQGTLPETVQEVQKNSFKRKKMFKN